MQMYDQRSFTNPTPRSGALRRWTLGRFARGRLRPAQDPSRPLRIALRLLLELVDVDLGGQGPAAALS